MRPHKVPRYTREEKKREEETSLTLFEGEDVGCPVTSLSSSTLKLAGDAARNVVKSSPRFAIFGCDCPSHTMTPPFPREIYIYIENNAQPSIAARICLLIYTWMDGDVYTCLREGGVIR